MLVHHVGHRTGRHYRQPVSYVTDGGTLLTPGGGRWTENLRDGETVLLRLRARAVSAETELIADPEEVARLLLIMTAENPMLPRFVRTRMTPSTAWCSGTPPSTPPAMGSHASTAKPGGS